MKTINFIDIFSGCGGLSLGFSQAKFFCLGAIDNNKDALETFSLNHPQSKILKKSIEQVTTVDLEKLQEKKKVHILVGGPPCQGFSFLGTNKKNDPRNFLFKEYLRIVKFYNPEVILFENVQGILSKKYEPIFKKIIKELTILGFHINHCVLNSFFYTTPQERKRVFILGAKKKILSFPEKKKKHLSIQDSWNSFLNKKKLYNHDLEHTFIKNALSLERLRCIPEGGSIRYQKDEDFFLPKHLKFNIDWNLLPEKRFREKKLQRLHFSKPSPTIVCSESAYYHPQEHRKLSCREAASCQGFPWNFQFKGTRTSIFKQIGNAVPPPLAFHIAQEIKKQYFDKK